MSLVRPPTATVRRVPRTRVLRRGSPRFTGSAAGSVYPVNTGIWAGGSAGASSPTTWPRSPAPTRRGWPGQGGRPRERPPPAPPGGQGGEPPVRNTRSAGADAESRALRTANENQGVHRDAAEQGRSPCRAMHAGSRDRRCLNLASERQCLSWLVCSSARDFWHCLNESAKSSLRMEKVATTGAVGGG